MSVDDRWERAQELFERFRVLPRERRQAELLAACAGDIALRTEVESLLEHAEQARETFLASDARWRTRAGPHAESAVATADSPSRPGALTSVFARDTAWADKLTGRPIGHYRLVRLIATGGMGCVFEARQERPSRAVAVKVLRPGFSAPAALARFRIEPEILGRLQHPNIAQVFESGVHEDADGALPYFAMELIPGAQPLIEHAVARRLSIRHRLELFATVCDAVHHGHQKGIIHRDLKPANILVGADGQPKVIDFGVARASDSDIVLTTQCTHAGDLIGTLRYMSPEQCDGDPAKIDTRSDIYALGVVLYELLTGAAPYDTSGTTVYRAIRIIKDDSPRQPSELNRALRGDLDAILLKTLDKDPARRYASAADLAQDIRRHLTGEPIDARPPGRWLRVIRWIGRRPLLASVVGSAAVLLLTVCLSYGYVWWRLLAPARVEWSADQRSVVLLSAGGRELYRWSAPPGGAIDSFEVIDRPAELGGGRAVIIEHAPRGEPPLSGSLCAYDLSQPSRELWRRSIRDEDILPSLRIERNIPAANFGHTIVLIADIYPEVPGEEIVTNIRGGPASAGMIRIYGQEQKRDKPLFQIWLDGGVTVAYWMRDARLLVCLGMNGVAHWQDRGQAPSKTFPSEHPLVIFALRPRLGFVSPSCLRETPRPDDDSDPHYPAWYLCLWPPNYRDFFAPDAAPRYSLSRPSIGEPGRGVAVGIAFGPTLAKSVDWNLNERGELLSGGRVFGGNPGASAQDVGALDHLELRPLPPIIGYENDPPCLTPREFWNNKAESQP